MQPRTTLPGPAGIVPPALVDGDGPELASPALIDFQFESHYDVLGVGRTATNKQVSDAFTEQWAIFDRIGRKSDAAAGAATSARLEALHKAKEVLTNPDKRAAYDRQNDAVHLSIADPAALPRLDLHDGLRWIARLTEQAPATHTPTIAEERPNTLLEQLLR
jgi:hypothetical protein